jgi:hypothetical protein
MFFYVFVYKKWIKMGFKPLGWLLDFPATINGQNL